MCAISYLRLLKSNSLHYKKQTGLIVGYRNIVGPDYSKICQYKVYSAFPNFVFYLAYQQTNPMREGTVCSYIPPFYIKYLADHGILGASP
jgi:DNA-dependent RNA polymerase auxiliary subunit epsilon